MTEIIEIKLDDISVSDRIRAVDEAHVDFIALGVSERGQMTPALVRHTPNGEKKFALVYGAHRYAALQKLGIETIRTEARKMSVEEARLAEIDENLMRHELTALDRALSLAERKRVYEELHPETKNGGDRKSTMFADQNDKVVDLIEGGEVGDQNDKVVDLKFTAVTAERMGVSERSIERAVALAKGLSEEARDAVRGTPDADNSSLLLRLAKLDPKKQKTVAKRRGKKPDAPLVELINTVEGKVAPEAPDPVAKLVAAFSRLDAKQKSKFQAAINELLEAA